MFINLTLAVYDKKYNIRIDSMQRIGVGLDILREGGKCPSGKIPDYFHSGMNQRLVSSYKTFLQEEVFDGDILTAVI